MSSSRDHDNRADGGMAPTASRRWVRPTLTRLSATRAEEGGVVGGDATLNS
jgi:hypothetical protein